MPRPSGWFGCFELPVAVCHGEHSAVGQEFDSAVAAVADVVVGGVPIVPAQVDAVLAFLAFF
jgi:hypothetical protein